MTTVAAGEPESNICGSTICNGVNVNNVIKLSVESSTFVVKPAINGVNFNHVVDLPKATGPLFF